jgi:hypothetical protein
MINEEIIYCVFEESWLEYQENNDNIKEYTFRFDSTDHSKANNYLKRLNRLRRYGKIETITNNFQNTNSTLQWDEENKCWHDNKYYTVVYFKDITSNIISNKELLDIKIDHELLRQELGIELYNEYIKLL